MKGYITLSLFRIFLCGQYFPVLTSHSVNKSIIFHFFGSVSSDILLFSYKFGNQTGLWRIRAEGDFSLVRYYLRIRRQNIFSLTQILFEISFRQISSGREPTAAVYEANVLLHNRTEIISELWSYSYYTTFYSLTDHRYDVESAVIVTHHSVTMAIRSMSKSTIQNWNAKSQIRNPKCQGVMRFSYSECKGAMEFSNSECKLSSFRIRNAKTQCSFPIRNSGMQNDKAQSSF